MSLSPLQEHVLAYFLAEEAARFTIDGRFFRREDFLHFYEDRLYHATQRFGPAVAGRHPEVAAAFVDGLIAGGGLSTTHNKLSGVYHQFQPDAYKRVVAEMAAANPIIAKAAAGDARYWDDAFAGELAR